MRKATVVMVVLFIFLFVFSGSIYADNQVILNKYFDAEYLKAITDMIHERYNYKVNDGELVDAAMKGIFSGLDRYTNYLTKDDAEALFNEMGGSYKGIGVMLDKINEDIIVVKTFEGSPAEQGGMYPSDKIIEVNGTSVVGKEVDDVAKLVRGIKGTMVTIKVLRGSKNQEKELKLIRSDIFIKPVKHEIIGDVAYIKLSEFNANAASEMKNVLDIIDEKKIKKVILDLRDNPGGEVSQVVEIAKNFVPKGVITRLEFRSDLEKDITYFSDLKNLKYKLEVLVNSNSASASEILAGALQDTKSGVLIGEKTYGKGRVQSVIPVLTPEAVVKYRKKTGVSSVDSNMLSRKFDYNIQDDEVQGWVKITTGEYFTPLDRNIDGKGLIPDVNVKNSDNSMINFTNIVLLEGIKQFDLGNFNNAILNAKKILLVLGYKIEQMTPEFDEEIKNAITVFQIDNQIEKTGRLDIFTQAKLNIKFSKARLKLDKQLNTALKLFRKK